MERIGDWMQTFSGRQFWPQDPRAEEIEIEDVAHALANQCRFAGHCRTFYSVAEHCVRVSEIVAPEFALWGLLHDASEAYLVDLPRPVKRFSEIGRLYEEIEARLMGCVCERFGLSGPMPAEVKRADNVLLMTEARDVMGPAPEKWMETERPLAERIVSWPAGLAESLFLEQFWNLREARG